MSTLSLRLPDSLHQKIRELAEQDEVSINQFIATAAAEKAAALFTVSYLEQRGRRADPRLVDHILRRVPDVPPAPGDELPDTRGPSRKPRRASGGARPDRRKSTRRARASRR